MKNKIKLLMITLIAVSGLQGMKKPETVKEQILSNLQQLYVQMDHMRKDPNISIFDKKAFDPERVQKLIQLLQHSYSLKSLQAAHQALIKIKEAEEGPMTFWKSEKAKYKDELIKLSNASMQSINTAINQFKEQMTGKDNVIHSLQQVYIYMDAMHKRQPVKGEINSNVINTLIARLEKDYSLENLQYVLEQLQKIEKLEKGYNRRIFYDVSGVNTTNKFYTSLKESQSLIQQEGAKGDLSKKVQQPSEYSTAPGAPVFDK